MDFYRVLDTLIDYDWQNWMQFIALSIVHKFGSSP